MPTLALAVVIMTAGLLALLLLLLRWASNPSLPRIVGEIVAAALVLGALGWSAVAVAPNLPR